MEMSCVAGILLAAGLSRRFGSDNKLLAPFRGLPLVLHAARTLRHLPLQRHVAVCGPDEDVAALLKAEGYDIAINPTPELGMSSSLVKGVASVSDAEAAMICLGDMPLVSALHLAALVAALSPTGVVASTTDGARRLPPAVFQRTHFHDLLATAGDAGARAVIAAATAVRAPAWQLHDIDTPEDLADGG